MSDGEQRWKCPKCSRLFRIPAGKSAPEVCPDCLRATAAEEVERLAKFAADEEADRVAMETFVKVEKSPEPEVFKEAEKLEKPAESKRLPTKDSLKIWRQENGVASAILFCVVFFAAIAIGVADFRLYAPLISIIMAMQSLQFSRISRELWQLRYEMAKRDHDSKNPQN